MKSIIIEGLDGTGKSTLSQQLSIATGFRQVFSGGPPIDLYDLVRWCRLQSAEVEAGGTILDRCSSISQRCYNLDLDSWTTKFLEDQARHLSEEALIVYCRPDTDVALRMDSHVIKPTDSKELLAFIDENKVNILERYDEIMSELPHIRYDYHVNSIEALLHELRP